MIPIRLEIEGLYSYRERQVIEFDTLTAAGLFGIFGAVGSGKSAILEGILLSLYGSPERVSNSGERASMINLLSSQVDLRLTFKSGANHASTYLARYSAKRNKKEEDKIETASHTFYQRIGEEWEATDKKAEELIGMSKENFKQTVIIPQGKFREFIDQKPLDRAQMMQELFGLDRFDLSAQTGSLLKAAREEKIRFDTQLKGLEEISAAHLEAKKEEVTQVSEEVLQASALFRQANKDLKTWEGIRKSFLQLQEVKSQAEGLEEKRPFMEEKRVLYRTFLHAKTYLRPIWDRIQDLEKDLEKYQVSFIDCSRFNVTFEEEVAELEKEERDLIKKNGLRPEREAKIRDLKKVLELQELDEKKHALQQELTMLAPQVLALKTEIEGLDQQLSQLETKREALPKSDPNQLASLTTQQLQAERSQLRIQELTQVLAQGEKALAQYRRQQEELQLQLPEGSSNWEEALENQKMRVKELELAKDQALRNQGLATHAHLLLSGQPCPLCGAAEHPLPLSAQHQEDAYPKLEKELQDSLQLLEKLREKLQVKNLLAIQYEHLVGTQKEKAEELQLLHTQEKELWKQLEAEGMANPQELQDRIAALTRAHQESESLLQQIPALRKLGNEKRAASVALENSLRQSELKQQDLVSRIAGKKQEIKNTEFCSPFFDKSEEQIMATLVAVERDIELAASSLLGKQKNLGEKKIAQSKNLADLDNFQREVAKHEKKLVEFRQELESLEEKHDFRNREALLRLFQLDLDLEKTEAELRHFEQQLSSANERLQELRSEEGIDGYSEEGYRARQQDLEQAQEREKTLQGQLTLLQEQGKEISKKLQEKTLIQASFLAIETRETHLRELEKLFSGKGFVKYVSSIYLRELCQTANKRFTALTKNSLRLEIDENNIFWVIDYLNGGKKRLLKTLSGGQTFQASLCLALALAEKVKALNQADQSFFFLDEGFGALDKNSLRVVFETLKALRHENRVVGIISHVEELQQEIGVYAQIELDPEKGSQVQYSFG